MQIYSLQADKYQWNHMERKRYLEERTEKKEQWIAVSFNLF